MHVLDGAMSSRRRPEVAWAFTMFGHGLRKKKQDVIFPAPLETHRALPRCRASVSSVGGSVVRQSD
jgi:hypothetical protein